MTVGILARWARLLVLAATSLALASCGGGGDGDAAADSGEPLTVVERASGRRAVVRAETFVDRPASIRVRVSAAPKQQVTVSYGLTCEREKSTGAAYDTTPPDVRSVRLPVRATDCAIVARAALLGRRSGRIKLTVLASER